MRPATIVPHSIERDLHGALFDMEDDLLTVCDLIAAIRLMVENPAHELGTVHTAGIGRVADHALDVAERVKGQWERALRLAGAQRKEVGHV